MLKRIVHVDMDAFYASVEQRDNPGLKGRPVAVGGDPARRGVVCAASYEARAYGVRSAMAMARAVRLCPTLVIVRPDFAKYRDVSAQIFELFRSVTPLVEPLSLDEAYLDVTTNTWGETLGMAVARRLKADIRERTGLTASAGVAPNKFLAKVASGWRKPDGLTVIAPDRVERFLHELPVDALWGVGPKTAQKLRRDGITRLVDVRTRSVDELRGLVGSFAEGLLALAHGRDARGVHPHREAKSSGSERTFESDLTDRARIETEVTLMARSAAAWLQRRELDARTVVLKVRYQDFTTVTRSHSEPRGSRDPDGLVRRALALLDRTDAGTVPVRLLGVSVQNFAGHLPLTTSSTPEAEESDERRRRAGLDLEPRLPFE